MRIGELFAFSVWLLNKSTFGLSSAIREGNRKFKHQLADDSGTAIVVWILVTLLTTLCYVLILLIIANHFMGTRIENPHVFFAATYLSVAYLATSYLGVLWAQFQAERQQVFDLLKD